MGIIIVNINPKIETIKTKKKSHVLEMENNNDDKDIWGFIADEGAIIDSEDEVFPNKKIDAIMTDMGYPSGNHLRKIPGMPFPFPKVNHLAHLAGLEYEPSLNGSI